MILRVNAIVGETVPGRCLDHNLTTGLAESYYRSCGTNVCTLLKCVAHRGLSIVDGVLFSFTEASEFLAAED